MATVDEPEVVDEPVVEKVEPVVEKVEPVVEKVEPVVEKVEPVVEKVDEPAENGGVEAALAASQSDLAKLQAARRSRLIKAIALTAIAIIFIVFILQNANPVDMRVLGWTVSVLLIWVIVASALLGALAGYLVGRPDKRLLLHGPSRRDQDPR